MAKTKKRRNGKKSTTLSVATTLPFLYALNAHYQDWKGSGFGYAMRRGTSYWTGYDISTGTFDLGNMSIGTAPVLIGGLVHKVANKLGINRMLSKSGIPYIRI